MREHASHDLGGLDLELVRRIDAVCRRFESDFRAGKSPVIADYLGEFPDVGRSALRSELIGLEQELRRADGTSARPDPGLIADAPTIAPASPPTAPIPGLANPSVHEDATVAPRDQATVDLGSRPPAPPDASAPAHVRYFGDYEIERELARGGMGVVFRARQVSLNRPVALKMILAGQLAHETDVKRFYTEAEAAANLDHPGIVPIFEVGQHEGQHYFSMGFVEGQSLSQRLTDGPLPPREAAALMVAVADAIDYAHQCGVIHRDLKPGNILLDQKGNPRVTDFGLAKRIQSDSGLTGSGQIMGTPSYMPPEQAGGLRGAVGPAADVYALGATLYALITGRPPFQAATAMDTVLQVLSDEPVPPRRLNPSIPRDLETIGLKCLEKKPDERYASAAALAADLRRFLTGEPIVARPVTRLERAAKWARRKPTLAASYLLGLLAVLLGGLGGTAAWQWRAAEGARDAAKSAQADAEQQRDTADVARRQADRARAAEKEARAEAERQQEKFERSEYGRTIEVAHQEWRDGNVAAGVALLGGTRADLRGWEWRYVYRLCHSVLALKGHTNAVNYAAFSPDNSRVVTASFDNTAKVWDAQSGAEIHTLRGHTRNVRSAAFSPDNSRVVTASYDNTAKIWDAKSGAEILTLSGHTGSVEFASFSPDGSRVVTASWDKSAKVWDAKSGDLVLTLKGRGFDLRLTSWGDGTGAPTSGNSLVIVGTDNNGLLHIRIFDATGRSVTDTDETKVPTTQAGEIRAFKRRLRGLLPPHVLIDAEKAWVIREATSIVGHTQGHDGPVTSASFSPDGSRLLTGSWDNSARVWDAKSGDLVLTLKGHDGTVSSVSFSPDGSRLLTGSWDYTAKVWDAKSGAVILTLRGHTNYVSSVSFSPDGSRLLTGSWDKSAKVWDAQSGDLVRTLKVHSNDLFSAAFSPDGSRVVTASGDRTAKIWDAKNGAETLTLKGYIQAANSATFSPDGTQVVTGSYFDGTAKVWDAKSGAQVRIFWKVWDAKSGTQARMVKREASNVFSASFSLDGSRVVTASQNGKATVWDARSGAEVLTFGGHIGNVASPSFSPDGSRVVTGRQDARATVWDAQSGAEILTLSGHKCIVTSAAFSADGSRVVTASRDGTAKVWDAQNGTVVLTLKGHNSEVTSAAFSPDGSRVVTASHDKTARVWDARSGGEVLTLNGHTNIVTSASFSPDGSRVLTGSWDTTAKLWDAESGAEVLTLKGHTDFVVSASFNRDGSRVVTGSADWTAKVWDARPPEPEPTKPSRISS